MHVINNPSQPQRIKNPWDSFLGISFEDPKAWDKARQQISGRSYPRDEMASILFSYNQTIGNDDAAVIAQIRALASPDSACVVAGQQLGMMGGAAYTILKAISCLLVARQTGSVPIFWLATEDHDIGEIDHTYLVDSMGNLQRFRLSFLKNGRSVEDLELTERNRGEIQAFWDALGVPVLSIGTVSYAEYMAKILVRFFAGTGIVFLEPKLLRKLATPFFRKELQENCAIQEVLKTTTNRLESVGGHPILHFNGGANLFLKNENKRRLKIHQTGDLFTAGNDRYRLEELLSLIDSEPGRFSTNVAARPVLQNALLPVIACIAGPAEMAYHLQLGDYHQYHGISMPCMVPRLSATFISPHIAKLLETYHLQPWDDIPHKSSDQEKFPGHGLHMLRNWLHPHERLQERVLNWWNFQAHAQENLIVECLNSLSWDSFTHNYLYYQS